MNYYTSSSERLDYRKLTLADIPAWSAFFVDNPNMRFVGSEKFVHLSPEEKATNWISRQMGHYENGNFGQLAIIESETGKFIGVSGLITREIEGETLQEVTYSLLPEFWNRGFATEAATHFRDFGFTALGCKTLISIIHVENEESEKVAAKNGMHKTFRTEFMDMPVHVFRIDKP